MFNRHNKLDVGWLAQVGFFAGFSPAELESVADLGRRLELEAGTILVDRGTYGRDCYVIVDGTAAVTIAGEFVTTVGPGTMVGEMALIEHRPRSATVTAERPMVVVAYDTDEFRALLGVSPTASDRVNAMLSARLQANEVRN